MSAVARFFQLEQHGTTLSREVIAGLTTFTTMSYIVVVNPAILSNAGIPAGPCFVATVVAAVFGCTLMGLYANRPFAIAPYMGENAFIAFTVCQQLGYKWQTALAAIFIAGALFVLLTVLRLRQWVVEAVPVSQLCRGNRALSHVYRIESDRDCLTWRRGSAGARGASHHRAGSGGHHRFSVACSAGNAQGTRRDSAGNHRHRSDRLCRRN
jgi:hypothetical protein